MTLFELFNVNLRTDLRTFWAIFLRICDFITTFAAVFEKIKLAKCSEFTHKFTHTFRNIQVLASLFNLIN